MKQLTKKDLINKIKFKFNKKNKTYLPQFGEIAVFKTEVLLSSPDLHQRHYLARGEKQFGYILSNENGYLSVRLRSYIEKYKNNPYLDNVIKLERFSKPDIENICKNF